MKTTKLLTVALLISVLSTSCHFYGDDFFHHHCINGVGNEVETTFKLPNFDGVQLTNNVDVYITQGSPQKVVVKGQGNIIDLLDLRVSRGVLDIGFRNCVNRHNIEIYLTMPDVAFVGNAGSGYIYGENFFDAFDIVLRNSGSGKIDLGLKATDIDASISGSGDIVLEGSAGYLSLKNSGSGDFEAFKLKNDKAFIQVTGSGDAATWVVKVLDVKISGSGNVYYKGSPIINLNRTGSGKLIDAN